MTEEVTDEMLMALADDELDPATAATLRARIAADPDLARRYQTYAGTAQALRAAFDPGPVPDRLVAAILGAQPARVLPFRRRLAGAGGLALAASLALAAGLGGYLLGRGAAGGPGLAELARLPTGESLARADGARWRALGSYETEAGLCRLLAREGAAAPGRRVICRDGGDWALALEVATGAGAGFVPASDPLTELTDRFLDDLGAGPALDAEAERRLLAP